MAYSMKYGPVTQERYDELESQGGIKSSNFISEQVLSSVVKKSTGSTYVTPTLPRDYDENVDYDYNSEIIQITNFIYSVTKNTSLTSLVNKDYLCKQRREYLTAQRDGYKDMKSILISIKSSCENAKEYIDLANNDASEAYNDGEAFDKGSYKIYSTTLDEMITKLQNYIVEHDTIISNFSSYIGKYNSLCYKLSLLVCAWNGIPQSCAKSCFTRAQINSVKNLYGKE